MSAAFTKFQWRFFFLFLSGRCASEYLGSLIYFLKYNFIPFKLCSNGYRYKGTKNRKRIVLFFSVSCISWKSIPWNQSCSLSTSFSLYVNQFYLIFNCLPVNNLKIIFQQVRPIVFSSASTSRWGRCGTGGWWRAPSSAGGRSSSGRSSSTTCSTPGMRKRSACPPSTSGASASYSSSR